MLRHLSAEHRITFLCLDDGTSGAAAHAAAAEYCEQLVTVPAAAVAKGSLPFYWLVARSLVEPLPYAILRYRSEPMRRRIAELAGGMDLVVCDFLAPSVNVPQLLPVASILFQHNVETSIWQRRARLARNPLARAYLQDQARKMADYEAAQCRRFDHVVAVSDADAATHRLDFGVDRVSNHGPFHVQFPPPGPVLKPLLEYAAAYDGALSLSETDAMIHNGLAQTRNITLTIK